MGERQVFQPLTREDRITVVLYRIGIVLSAAALCGVAYAAAAGGGNGVPQDLFAWGLQAAVGLCCFFIHLYMRVFKKYLVNLYLVSAACFAVLAFLGKGSPSAALVQAPVRAMLLLPLSGCLGFVTAKEAFCFRLLEGYVLALLMPFYLLLVAGRVLIGSAALSGLSLIAALLLLFTARKAFMPLAYDIGDKTAYR